MSTAHSTQKTADQWQNYPDNEKHWNFLDESNPDSTLSQTGNQIDRRFYSEQNSVLISIFEFQKSS